MKKFEIIEARTVYFKRIYFANSEEEAIEMWENGEDVGEENDYMEIDYDAEINEINCIGEIK